MDSYEQWTRSEIARLKAEAEKALAESATLQRAFDKWLESQAPHNESRARLNPNETRANGHAPQQRSKVGGYGDKNATALEKIKAATPGGGLTTDNLYAMFTELYGPKYKRSSLRALLWHQKKLENIENRDGRYVIASKG